MMLSTNTASNKTTKNEIHSESKNNPITVTKSPTSITFEQSKVIKKDKLDKEKHDLNEKEQNDLKGKEKCEKSQTMKGCSMDAKIECSKSMEHKMDDIKVSKEIKEIKSSNNDTAKKESQPKCKLIPIGENNNEQKPSNVAVPRKYPPLPAPLLSQRPLVLTTHLVPSLPITLFEVFVEVLEVATERPVVLLYEPRSDRPVAKDVADIAILPASEEWEDGELLPVSFCFQHHLNKTNSPCVYADVIVAADRASHVKDITDLRGHRCSLPDRKKNIGTAALLFNYLHTKGESPAFFGNTLDANTQVAALQMVAGKQAETGILESPVIHCHKNLLPGINSLHILTSLGPLPPYRIMVKKTLSDMIVKKITAYLLNIHQDEEWMDKFAPFGVTGFSKNFAKLYELTDLKSVATSVPYY